VRNSRINLYVDASPISTAHMSGIGHTTLELVRALSRLDEFRKDFNLVLVASVRSRARLKGLNIEGAKLVLLPIPTRVLNRLPGVWFVPFLDLLIGRGVYLFTNYRAWPLAFSPSITFIYDVSYITQPQTQSARHQKFLAAWVPTWVRRSTKIASISHNASAELTELLGVPESKLVYVPCGVDMTVFRKRTAAEVAALAQAHLLPQDYILYLGNIEPRKNLVNLILAYRALSERIKSRHPLLLVGGDGWQNHEIHVQIESAQAAGEQIVHPTSYIADDELPALYSGAAMLAHPAIYEGFGLTPLQAMACGTPVMAGNNSSMPEVTGGAAILVDVASREEMTTTMATILTDQSVRSRLEVAGPQRARHYDWLTSAQRLMTVIESIKPS
jgi:glycosyltransferase involved in cell wall biosynthesis